MMKVREGKGFLAALAVASGVFGLTACGALNRPAAGPAQPAEVAKLPPPSGPGAETQGAPGLDPREERRLAKELGKEVEDYYRLLKEKNVEAAAAFVEPQFQKAYLDELWTFAASYSVEGIQDVRFQFFPQPDGTLAKTKVVRTLFERGSVVPQRSEVTMTWMQRGGKWLIHPPEKK